MAGVGLIVNPSAARDVRRLTSLARTIDFPERVNTVARILAGLRAAGAVDVLYMPETDGVVERALGALAATPRGHATGSLRVVPIGVAGDGLARDASGTSAAAAAMATAGVACVLTLGGDGTNRAVVAGWPDAVLIPLPGGTNNAFATWLDPTAAGLAAGTYAADPVGAASHVRRAPMLVVRTDSGASRIALVDVAVVVGAWIGARAIWEPATLLEAVTTRSDPTLTGLAGAAGFVRPLHAGRPVAMHVRFGGDGRRVLVPLGPGQLEPICVRECRLLEPGDRVTLGDDRPDHGPVTIAMDGEREITLGPGDRATVELVLDGPFVVDAASLLRSAVAASAAAWNGAFSPDATAATVVRRGAPATDDAHATAAMDATCETAATGAEREMTSTDDRPGEATR